jgi:non-canonical (house-cleaning) NTP pyrophosphatase
MEKLMIALGTTSDQKITYLKEVLEELKIQAQLIPTEVASGVSDQPKTTEETEQGSINRAQEAFGKALEADFAMGIEVGYHKNNKDEYEMFCWVTIIDKNGYQLSSQSHKFLLPKYHQGLLNNDLYLGDNLDGYMQDEESTTHVKKQIDDIVRYRKPFIENALRSALIQYLQKEDFG